MQFLHEALAAGATSNVLRTTIHSTLWVDIQGTFNTETVTMEYSVDGGLNYVTFTADGVDQTWTAQDQRVYNVPGGLYFRFTVSSGSGVDLDIHVDGTGLHLE